MTNTESTSIKEKPPVKKIIFNSLGILLCVILLPILIFNCILIVKGIIYPDQVPSIGKYTPMIVLTGSMEDTIKPGDLIICEKIDAGDVKEGDVISFFDPTGKSSSVTTHRVNSITHNPTTGELMFYTQGDNNNIEDITPVPAENLVGKWTGIRIWGLGHIILFTQSPIGLVLCVFIPIGVVVLLYLLNKKKQDGAKQQDINALKQELEQLKRLQSEQQAGLSQTTGEQTATTTTSEENPSDNKTEE